MLRWQPRVVSKIGIALYRPLLTLSTDSLFEDISTIPHGFRNTGILGKTDEVEVVRIRQLTLLNPTSEVSVEG